MGDDKEQRLDLVEQCGRVGQLRVPWRTAPRGAAGDDGRCKLEDRCARSRGSLFLSHRNPWVGARSRQSSALDPEILGEQADIESTSMGHVLSGFANEVAAIGAISVGIKAWVPGNQAGIWSSVSGICLFAWLMLVLVAETVESRSH